MVLSRTMSYDFSLMTQQTERYRREWARLIGKRRLDAFERALCDPDLVSMKQELAKLDLRITELEERAQKGESRGAWSHVKNFAREIQTCLVGDDPKTWEADKVKDLTARLEACANQGLDDFALWDEVKDLIERRRKISDTERKYEEFHKLLIPAAEIARMFDDLHAAIEAILPDRETQRALFHEVRVRLNADRRSAAAVIPLQLPSAFLEATATGPGAPDDGPDAVDDV